ncbi:MAG: hypothetical protein IJF33_06475 [Clostridia bacterium]|nr:hypothetical protein [Clostridia bacterium]
MKNFLLNVTRLASAEKPELELVFDPANFIENIGYIGAGMLGIFIVIGLIIGATCLLNFATRPKK